MVMARDTVTVDLATVQGMVMVRDTVTEGLATVPDMADRDTVTADLGTSMVDLAMAVPNTVMVGRDMANPFGRPAPSNESDCGLHADPVSHQPPSPIAMTPTNSCNPLCNHVRLRAE